MMFITVGEINYLNPIIGHKKKESTLGQLINIFRFLILNIGKKYTMKKA